MTWTTTCTSELRNFQKSLVRYFAAMDPPHFPIFVENNGNIQSREKELMGAGQHCVVQVFPVELDRMGD